MKSININFKSSYMKTITYTAFAIVVLLFAGCAPHVDCGLSGKPPKVMSKRYKAALTERDTLCSQLKMKKEELETANKKYQELKAASGNTMAMLSSDLEKKQKELNGKENALKE